MSRSQLFDTVSLHEKTVQQPPRLPRQPRLTFAPARVFAVETNRAVPLDDVDPRVVREALRLAGGDLKRIVTVSVTEVLVVNA